MSYCSDKYGSLSIPDMLRMIEERDKEIERLQGEPDDAVSRAYASDEET